jgi:hypothetical protein
VAGDGGRDADYRGAGQDAAGMSAGDGLAGGAGASAPGRRALLIASVAALPALLSACRGIQSLGAPPPPSADVRKLRAAIEQEARLVASYAAAAAAGSSAGPAGSQQATAALAAVLAEHRQHLARLKSRLIEPAAAKSADTALGPAGANGRAGQSDGVSPTIDQLEQAEQAASDWLIAQLAGLPPTLAQLFASIAASEATHVPYLQAARRGQ